ncbi:MAG: ribosome silencing factor [Oscillospiraceae bacterium]|nr:ribosome silencing factor [Oscillospiraceae bacterium]
MAAAVRALDSKKGKNIQVLHTTEITTLADYFVLCTAGSTTQIKALTDEVEEKVEAIGGELHHKEGFRDGGWVLLDFSDVVVHVFLEEQRDFYDLERLWADAQAVDIAPYLARE